MVRDLTDNLGNLLTSREPRFPFLRWGLLLFLIGAGVYLYAEKDAFARTVHKTCWTCKGRGVSSCPSCAGSGLHTGSEALPCDQCKGTGSYALRLTPGQTAPCPYCGGDGRREDLKSAACATCRGRGFTTCGTCAGKGVVAADRWTEVAARIRDSLRGFWLRITH